MDWFDFVSEMAAQTKVVHVIGYNWMQGQTDANSLSTQDIADDYQALLLDFVSSIKGIGGEAPFYINYIDQRLTTHPFRATILAAQQFVVANGQGQIVGYNTESSVFCDQVHYDRASTISIGLNTF